MDETFHPSSLGEILDRAAQLYRARFLIFLGIGAIPTAALVAPLGGILLLVRWMGVQGDSPTRSIIAGLGIAVVSLVAIPLYIGVTSLATAALNHAASRAIFAQPINVRHAYQAVWPRGWHYVGLYLLQLVAVWVLPIGAWTGLIMISAVASALVGGSGSALLGFVVILIVAGLIGYGVWISIRLSLAFPAAIVERSGPWSSLRRSWTLSNGTRGRILLLYLLGSALNWILSLAIMVPLLIGLSMMPGADTPQHQQSTGIAAMFIIYGSSFVIQAFVRPVYGIALMLFYYDQRIRHEAFDIEWMMLQAGLVVPPIVPSTAPPATEEPAVDQGAAPPSSIQAGTETTAPAEDGVQGIGTDSNAEDLPTAIAADAEPVEPEFPVEPLAAQPDPLEPAADLQPHPGNQAPGELS